MFRCLLWRITPLPPPLPTLPAPSMGFLTAADFVFFLGAVKLPSQRAYTLWRAAKSAAIVQLQKSVAYLCGRFANNKGNVYKWVFYIVLPCVFICILLGKY